MARMTPEAWVLVASMVLNAAQAMWTQYLRARYQLVIETQEAVERETGTNKVAAP